MRAAHRIEVILLHELNVLNGRPQVPNIILNICFLHPLSKYNEIYILYTYIYIIYIYIIS